MTSDRQREHMTRSMDLLVRYKSRVHYAQFRPMRTMRIHPGHLRRALLRPGGITMDCSESVTLICHLAGLRDPNGSDYDGEGNTGTLLHYLEHRDRLGRTGSLAVFGAPPGEHVVMRRDELRWFSHGTEADPNYYTLEVLRDAFRGQPVTFLSIAKLGMEDGR
jgi:hypothetical protein